MKSAFARLVYALGLALALLLPMDAALAQSYRFTNLKIEGNQRIESSTIVSYLGIERGAEVTAAQLNDGYQRLVASNAFETVELVPQGSTLVVKVTEYPTINRINFEGNRRIKNDALSELIESESRRVLNPAQVERDAGVIAEAYSQQGRIAATVRPQIIRRNDNRVDLVFEIDEGATIEIERVSFVGNRAFTDRRLRQVMQSKQATFLRAFVRNDTLIEDRIEFDKQVLREFYLSRGYVDFRINSANVELTQERDGFFLLFDLYEGNQFKFGNITVTSDMAQANADDYAATLRIKPGVIYSPTLMEQAITRMERLAVRQGIDFMRVEPRVTRNDRQLTLDVDFVLVRGPRVFVERIDIEGNTTTLDRVIRQQFTTVEGDPFNPRAIRQSAERIKALGYFADANVETREGSSPEQQIIDVNVEEKPTGSLTVGGSYSIDSGVGINLGLTEDNFLGRGQRLRFVIATAQDADNFQIGFTEPYLLGRDLRFDLDLGLGTTSSSYRKYNTSARFFRPALTFSVNEFSRVSFNYSYSNSEMEAQNSTTNGPIILSEIAQGRKTSSALGFNYAFDSRTNGLDPNSGLLIEFGTEVAGVGGDNKYIKSNAKAVAQTRVYHEEVVLRATFETGALRWQSDQPSRAEDRFTLSTNRMRGFEPAGIGPRQEYGDVNDPLGGNQFAVLRLDAEFPIGLPEELGIRGGLFYDIGTLWNLADVNVTGPGVVGRDMSLRHVIGFSVLWTTAIGPLRFNFSKAIKKEDFDRSRNFDLTVQATF
ncbi:outer membrane protein assembly factor BamA [Chachezhania sediminis]|uniref:outer membrane protein assembly factor BamA n=1 Tax=Chachezhania sediminis TaxID=2599291 RepID=UPI00131BADA3|nr:outer membrane protein assembly factor BamA [Chachezhania sediminis]